MCKLFVNHIILITQMNTLSSRNATVKVILYTSKTLSNGEHPIMLKITKNRIRKYIALGINSTLEQWDKNKEQPKPRHPNRVEIVGLISRIEKEFNDKIQEFSISQREYSIQQLVDAVSKNTKTILVFDFFDQHIKNLTEEGRTGYAKTFNDCKQMLMKFSDNSSLSFLDINFSFLSQWESWMRKNDFKETSMAVYFTTFRVLYNKAVKEELISHNTYPFKDFKVSKFNTRTRKRAIEKEEILKIEALELADGSKLKEAQNIFIFSYFNQGMNFIDIAELKWGDITKNWTMMYERNKTGHNFTIQLNEKSIAILQYYQKITGGDSKNYVFPILNKERHIEPNQIYNRAKKVLKQVNANLKILAKQVGIDADLTTYVARHTYATVLKKSGFSNSVIGEGLGHALESTTNIYLADLGLNTLYEANKSLL